MKKSYNVDRVKKYTNPNLMKNCYRLDSSPLFLHHFLTITQKVLEAQQKCL